MPVVRGPKSLKNPKYSKATEMFFILNFNNYQGSFGHTQALSPYWPACTTLRMKQPTNNSSLSRKKYKSSRQWSTIAGKMISSLCLRKSRQDLIPRKMFHNDMFTSKFSLYLPKSSFEKKTWILRLFECKRVNMYVYVWTMTDWCIWISDWNPN